MAGQAIPHFQNDQGLETIRIGAKEFMCCGASAPHDHPHVFLDMGDENEIVCPYCSTRFIFKDTLKAAESDPPGCEYAANAA